MAEQLEAVRKAMRDNGWGRPDSPFEIAILAALENLDTRIKALEDK